MDADLDTLATALYVRIDDALKDDPSSAPWRPAVGIEPKLTDAELACVFRRFRTLYEIDRNGCTKSIGIRIVEKSDLPGVRIAIHRSTGPGA